MSITSPPKLDTKPGTKLDTKPGAKRSTKPGTQRNTLRQLLAPYRTSLTIAYLLSLVNTLLLIVQSALLAYLFANWLNAISNQQPLDKQPLMTTLPYLAMCLLIRPWLDWFKTDYLQRLSTTVRANLRERLLQHLGHLGPERRYFGSDGSLSARVIEQVDAIDGYISRYYVQQFSAVATPIIIAGVTFIYSPLAAILLLLTAPLVPVFMVLVGSAASKKSREQLQTLSQLSGRFLDLLRGMPTLKRLHATDTALNWVRTSATQYQHKTMSVLRLAFLSGAILELFASLSIALVAVYLGLGLLGILPWQKGVIPVPYQGALFILLLAPEFYAPLRQLGSDYHAKANAQAAMEELTPLLSIDHGASGEQISSSAKSYQPTQQIILQAAPSLTLDKVSIVDRSHRLRLAECSLTLQPAERIALSGASGLGKSSILQAILGFSPYQGDIYLNHHSYAQLDLRQLRTQFAYLEQSPPLMPLSIADNLRLAKANASDAELQAVLEQVHLWSLITQLPARLETLLGERGQGLSGGQQQRLALAQLLLGDHHVWLLDEPCAHLDPQTASDIYQLIGTLTQGKTLILVTHDTLELDWLDRRVNLKHIIHAEGDHE